MISMRACAVVLAVVVACDKKQDAPPPAPKPAPPAEAKPPEEMPADPFASWAERKGDGFSVMAPQDPQVTTKQTTQGKPLPTTMYTRYVPDGPGAVQVMFTPIDPKEKVEPTAMFEAMKASMVKQFAATITKHQDISAGDVKGEEYWLDGEHPQMGKLRVHAKFIVANGRLYLVQALHAADAADFAALGDKFVGSFKLR